MFNHPSSSGHITSLAGRPEAKYNDTDGVAAYVGTVYVDARLHLSSLSIDVLIDHSGDETLKAISCLTEWALRGHHATDSTDVNFDSFAPPPELDIVSAAGPTSAETPVTRYDTVFNLAFKTQLGYFPWIELPENEGRFARFGHAMVSTRQCETKDEILAGRYGSESGLPWLGSARVRVPS